MQTVLIADDEAVILKVLGRFLQKEGRTLLLASTGDEALALARTRGPIDVALLDKNFGNWSGLELAARLKDEDPHTEVILVTAYVSLQSAIEAVQLGAYDYVSKPIEDFDALGLKVTNAAHKAALAREHRRTVAALAESELRYRQLFETSPDALLVLAADGQATREANPAAGALFGLTPEELAARPVRELFGPAEERSELVRGVRADGTIFLAEAREGEVELGGERLATWALRDVSVREELAAERQRVEAQLRHAQKMEAVSRLAGGIGHDLGNLLSVVLTLSDILSTEQPGSEDLAAIRSAAERASALVRQMMAMARRSPASPTSVAPGEVVGDTVRMLRRTLDPAIEIASELSPEAPRVMVDPGQLGQVVLNLAINARDAMPHGGRLTLRALAVELLERASRRAGLTPGRYAAIEVEDQGTGMSAEVREKIFEPFFTTKEAGKGTGLGLAVTYGIVSQAGGAIEVESELGRGTLFRVLLPRALEPEEHPGFGLHTGSRDGLARLTALVAEDDPSLREALARELQGAGMRVLSAGSGEEALEVAHAHGQGIDVLVSDVVMPRMSGQDLARRLTAKQPGVKVLFITGFPGDPRAVEAAGLPGELLQKPFRGAALVERVQKLVATSPVL